MRTIFIAAGVLLGVLLFSNNPILFQLAYTFISAALIMHTFLRKYGLKDKLFLVMIYAMIYTFQTVYNTLIAFSEGNNLFMSIIHRIIGMIIVLIPFTIDGMLHKDRGIRQLPSIEDIKVFTFNEIVENIETVKKIVEKGGKTLSKGNINALLSDLPRHNSFRYINKGSLTGEYFDLARQTLNDLNMYIIVSNTGSPASEIISIFTRKQYNHVSMSFDRDLKTIISYNGGEKIYPPGLNMETVKYFNKKDDSSIIVYSLPVPREKKELIIGKIREINEQGNAYNILGLVLKFSFKPNIMFCSQFVYKMLKIAGINYFNKKDDEIKPTDFIELDYDRKLKYEYKLKFNGDI